jgi:probable F420-dependent oxidoreductase
MALTSVSVSVFALSKFYGEDLAGVIETARVADASGVDHLALPEHVVMGRNTDAYPFGTFPYPPEEPWLEPTTTIGAMAAATERIRLGISILITTVRPAPLVAKTAATLDVLSGGRFELGVGTGWQREEIEACGVPFDGMRDRLADTVRACRVLWRDAPALFTSPTVSFDELWCLPFPVQAGGVPLWFGVPPTARNAELIAEVGAGWLPLGRNWTLDDVAAGAARIRDAFVARGRDPGELGVRAVLPPVVGDDGTVQVDRSLEEGLPRLAAAGVTSATIPLSVYALGPEHVRPFLEDLGRRWQALRPTLA